jgi:lycopene beta-cyclase
LLDILKNRNDTGPDLFTTMFGKNPAKLIFKFLDEDTSIIEDLKIISSFNSGPFLQALVNQLKP